MIRQPDYLLRPTGGADHFSWSLAAFRRSAIPLSDLCARFPASDSYRLFVESRGDAEGDRQIISGRMLLSENAAVRRRRAINRHTVPVLDYLASLSPVPEVPFTIVLGQGYDSPPVCTSARQIADGIFVGHERQEQECGTMYRDFCMVNPAVLR